MTHQKKRHQKGGKESSPKAVFGKTRKEVALEVFYPENIADFTDHIKASVSASSTPTLTPKIPKNQLPTSTTIKK